MHAIGMEKEFHRKRLIHELVSCHLISGLGQFPPRFEEPGRGRRRGWLAQYETNQRAPTLQR
jgi:hypothetical protein